jgi:hypothetical protein
MKKLFSFTIFCLVLFCLTLIASCRKPVSGDNMVWVGTWLSEDQSELLKIYSNGRGDWEKVEKKNGATTKLTGRVKFSPNSFMIRGSFIKQNFVIGDTPKDEVTWNSTTQTFAILNDRKFIKH